MINWLRQNAVILSIAGTAVLLVSHAAVSQYQLSGLVAGQAAVGAHIHDTTKHLDPHRDPEAMRRLTERIDKLEEKLERSERWRERLIEQWRQRQRQSGNDGDRR